MQTALAVMAILVVAILVVVAIFVGVCYTEYKDRTF